jgi:GT2 family glycosyltransferase
MKRGFERHLYGTFCEADTEDSGGYAVLRDVCRVAGTAHQGACHCSVQPNRVPPKSMTDLLFSICIPVRNDPENLKRCVAGFQKQDLSDCEIIVCDDGSSPPISADELAESGVRFTLIMQRGQGPSVARNHLASVARGIYLFFIDADTVPESHMLERARKIVAAQPTLDVFYGSYDEEPADGTLVSSYKNLLHHHTHQHSADAGQQVTTFWCGCGVIRRELYLMFGGLSEFYDKPSIEDIELGVRLSASGIGIRIIPELQVKHMKRWTFTNWLYTDMFRRGIPWMRLMRATNDWTSQLNFSWVQRIGALSATLLTACILLAPVSPRVFGAVGLFALVVFLIPNMAFIRLVRRKRGLAASVAVVPLHIIYSLTCVISAAAAFLYPPLKLPPRTPLVAKENNVAS